MKTVWAALFLALATAANAQVGRYLPGGGTSGQILGINTNNAPYWTTGGGGSGFPLTNDVSFGGYGASNIAFLTLRDTNSGTTVTLAAGTNALLASSNASPYSPVLTQADARYAVATGTTGYTIAYAIATNWYTLSNTLAVAAQVPGTIATNASGLSISNAGTYFVEWRSSMYASAGQIYKFAVATNGVVLTNTLGSFNAGGASTHYLPTWSGGVITCSTNTTLQAVSLTSSGGGQAATWSNLIWLVRRLY